MKKIIIVGSSSSFAKHLIPELSNSYDIVTAGRKNCDIYLDLSEKLEQIDLPEDAEIIIHFATCSEGKTDEEIYNTEVVNALGTLKVCMIARKTKIRHLIIISSIYATLKSDSSYHNIYSLSKKHSEDLAVYYCNEKNIPLTIIRPSQLYDDRDFFRKSQPLIYRMADSAEKGSDIVIYGSNDALRNYIHIQDMIVIVKKVIEKKCIGIYSCLYPKDDKLSEIAKAAFSAFNNGGNIIFDKNKMDISNNVFKRDVLLYEKIGFFPQINIYEGMKKISEFRRRIDKT